MVRLAALGLAMGCLCTTVAFAQDEKGTDQPAKYVWYSVDKFNSGKFEVYAKLVSQLRDAANTTAPDLYWIAGSPITGESDHVTIVTFHDNMASVEKMWTAFDKVYHAANVKYASLNAESAESSGGSHFVLAQYDKDISYRPDMVPLANTTWWGTTLLSLNPGCQSQLQDVAKQVIEMHKKAGDKDHWIAYDIRAGYPEPTVLFVQPMRSLADEDEEPPATTKELFESPPVRQMFSHFDKECVRHIESEYTRVEPQLSRPTQALLAQNPEFWTVKEEVPNTGKNAKPKKGVVRPAVMKEESQ
jgi:hypothetical protein